MSITHNSALTVTLHSHGVMTIAKLLSWAIAGYREAQFNRQPVGTFIALLSDGYGVSPVLAEKVLRGQVSYCQDEGQVVLLLDQAEADAYQHRRAAIDSRDIPRSVVTTSGDAATRHH
jgi:alkaline phosphatase